MATVRRNMKLFLFILLLNQMIFYESDAFLFPQLGFGTFSCPFVPTCSLPTVSPCYCNRLAEPAPLQPPPPPQPSIPVVRKAMPVIQSYVYPNYFTTPYPFRPAAAEISYNDNINSNYDQSSWSEQMNELPATSEETTTEVPQTDDNRVEEERKEAFRELVDLTKPDQPFNQTEALIDEFEMAVNNYYLMAGQNTNMSPRDARDSEKSSEPKDPFKEDQQVTEQSQSTERPKTILNEKCNDEKLRVLMEKKITISPKTSKQIVYSAASAMYPEKNTNVICSKHSFSYVVVTSPLFCEHKKGPVTCFVFFQPLNY